MMEDLHEPSGDSLALARMHVRTLTEGGVSRKALLRALLEQEDAGNDVLLSLSAAFTEPQWKQATFAGVRLPSQAPQSHWSTSTTDSGAFGQSFTVTVAECEEDERPGGSDQLSIWPGISGSKSSSSSIHTTSITPSPHLRTLNQPLGAVLVGSRPASASTRAYWCTSCDSEFKRKFDWKRHEDEFHERYKKYPCPDCNRVFWGANTFNQHHKTRHNCKTCPHSDKVIKYTRMKRAWACGFCAAFLPSMDRQIDHIGLHYESGRTKAHWCHSNVIYGLLHQPGVIDAWKNIILSKFNHIPKDQQPRYGWDGKTTGRKQGFLENETGGNLQDLLEFFNPLKDDPVKVARMAFDLAELISAQTPKRGFAGVLHRDPQPTPHKLTTTKREKARCSKRKPSPLTLDVAESRAVTKERHTTRWPGLIQTDMAKLLSFRPSDADVQMGDYDATAVPRPLFMGSMSPQPMQAPPHQQQQDLQQPQPPLASRHPQQTLDLAISLSPDQSTSLTPTSPVSQVPSSPFSNMSRDTLVDILSDYMTPDHMQSPPPHLMPEQAFDDFQDWTSTCSTVVDDVDSPRLHGPPLPPTPNEQYHPPPPPRERRQPLERRSDVWAGPESLYLDNVQACDKVSSALNPMMDYAGGRPSDILTMHHSIDYERPGYKQVIAPALLSAGWL